MPGSTKRSTQAKGGRTTRREGARPGKRPARTRNTRQPARRVGWSRRVGVATALVLLIGAGIAFASGALDDRNGNRDGTAQATFPPLPAPTLLTPDPVLTRLAAIDIAGVLPATVEAGHADRLRVYVNDHLARERGVPGEISFTLSGIPLDEGENEILAVLVADDREGDPSAPILVIRDSTPPEIRITRPEAGATSYGATETVRGRTEAGASLEITDEGSTHPVDVPVAEDGRFEAPVRLQLGDNAFVLRSEDPAGNRASTRLIVTRAVSRASINLTLSVKELALADLPTTIDVVAVVHDELGHASEGAEVTFGLSPPNRGTSTYEATTADGRATWRNMIVAGNARAAGTWLVTVLATMPSGEELRGNASFTVR